MARETAGRLVTYDNPDGTKQKAIMRYSDQRVEFQKVKKAFLRLVDEDYNFMKDGQGKKIVALKSITLLTSIGMVD